MIGDGIRGPIVRWILDLHNNVNQRQDPPAAQWTVPQVMAAYAGGKGDKGANVAAAVTALQGLQGVIGADAYAAALALLNSLA